MAVAARRARRTGRSRPLAAPGAPKPTSKINPSAFGPHKPDPPPLEWTLPDIDGIQAHVPCNRSGTIAGAHGAAGRKGKLCKGCRGAGVRKAPSFLWTARDEVGRQICVPCLGEGELPSGKGDEMEDCWNCRGEGQRWP